MWNRVNLFIVLKVACVLLVLWLVISIANVTKIAKTELVKSTFHVIPTLLSSADISAISEKFKSIQYNPIVTLANKHDTFAYMKNNDVILIVFESNIRSADNYGKSKIMDPSSMTISDLDFVEGAKLIFARPKYKNGASWRIDNRINMEHGCGKELSISFDHEYWNYIFRFKESRCIRVDTIMKDGRVFTCVELPNPRSGARARP